MLAYEELRAYSSSLHFKVTTLSVKKTKLEVGTSVKKLWLKSRQETSGVLLWLWGRKEVADSGTW